MIQWLRALDVLAEDPSSFSRISLTVHSIYSSNSRGSDFNPLSNVNFIFHYKFSVLQQKALVTFLLIFELHSSLFIFDSLNSFSTETCSCTFCVRQFIFAYMTLQDCLSVPVSFQVLLLFLLQYKSNINAFMVLCQLGLSRATKLTENRYIFCIFCTYILYSLYMYVYRIYI